MKILKTLGLVPVFMALFVLNAGAADWFMGVEDYAAGVPSQSQKESMMEQPSPEGILFRGTLAALNDIDHEIVINTTVPGLLGPQQANVPFAINMDTTMTVCIKSVAQCDSATTGTEGWQILGSLENLTSLSLATKDVAIVQEPETGRIVHVEVEYEL